MNFFLVFNGYWSWLRTVAILVDGIEWDQFCPSSFLRCHLEKIFLKKGEHLETNLRTLSDCKESEWLKLFKYNKLNDCKNSHTRTGAYGTDAICLKLCRRACVPSSLDDTSTRHLPGRSNGFSNPYLNLVFQIWPSTMDSWKWNCISPSTCLFHPDSSSEEIPSLSASWLRQS